MNPSRGYYCLIQYCPDLSRLEAANVGVLLFCPERQFIKARTARGNDRVKRFFGRDGLEIDRDQINAMKETVEGRLEVEAGNFTTLEDLERFIATRANEIQITPPRPMKVFEPETDLDQLFEELVGGRAAGSSGEPSPKAALSRMFEQRGVMPLIRSDVEVAVPAFHRRLSVPFAFQNGRLNLVQPEKFQGCRSGATISKVCRYAIEGRSLYQNRDPEKGDLQLVLVARTAEGGPDDREAMQDFRDRLDEHSVKFFTFDEVDGLIEEIKTTAKAPTT